MFTQFGLKDFKSAVIDSQMLNAYKFTYDANCFCKICTILTIVAIFEILKLPNPHGMYSTC